MKKLIQRLFFSVLIVLVSGCGFSSKQMEKTKSFGTTTVSIGELGKEEFIAIRNGIIAMTQRLVTMNRKRTTENLLFDQGVDANRTIVRVNASKALSLYGELLVGLASEEQSDQLSEVADALVDHTDAALHKGISDKKKHIISGAVATLGSFWVQKKKAEAARVIIPAYEESVDQLANLLRRDLTLSADSMGYLKAYEIRAKMLKNRAILIIDSGKKYSLMDRSYAVDSYVMAEKAFMKAEALSQKMDAALTALKKANHALVKIIKGKKLSRGDIKRYAKQLRKLANIYKIVQ